MNSLKGWAAESSKLSQRGSGIRRHAASVRLVKPRQLLRQVELWKAIVCYASYCLPKTSTIKCFCLNNAMHTPSRHVKSRMCSCNRVGRKPWLIAQAIGDCLSIVAFVLEDARYCQTYGLALQTTSKMRLTCKSSVADCARFSVPRKDTGSEVGGDCSSKASVGYADAVLYVSCRMIKSKDLSISAPPVVGTPFWSYAELTSTRSDSVRHSRHNRNQYEIRLLILTSPARFSRTDWEFNETNWKSSRSIYDSASRI